MHDPARVGRLEGGGHPAQQRARLAGRQPSGRCQACPQGHSFEAFHHEVGAAPRNPEVVHHDDIRVVEGSNETGLMPESGYRRIALDELVPQHFHRHTAAELCIHRLVNRAHAPASQAPLEEVPLAHAARSAGHREGACVGRTASHPRRLAPAAFRTLHHRAGLLTLGPGVEDEGQAVGDGLEKILVVEAVGLFGAAGPQNEHRPGTLCRGRERDE